MLTLKAVMYDLIYLYKGHRHVNANHSAPDAFSEDLVLSLPAISYISATYYPKYTLMILKDIYIYQLVKSILLRLSDKWVISNVILLLDVHLQNLYSSDARRSSIIPIFRPGTMLTND